MADLTVVDITSGYTDSKFEALEVLDVLRADIESDAVVCFVGVSITRDDASALWIANVGRAKSLLQMVGAAEAMKLRLLTDVSK